MSGKERDTTIGSNQPPIWRHSQSQRAQKLTRDRREKGFGNIDRALKAQSRKERVQQLLEEERLGKELLPSRSIMQFNRALGHMIDGTQSNEDVVYAAKEIDKYERVLERRRFKTFRNGEEINVAEVTTGIVDFTPHHNAPAR